MATDRTQRIETALLARNSLFERFFAQEADRLAEACRAMSERFLSGGRLLAFGIGPYATDAQHVSVEFVHPVIVGKRALAALDLSLIPEAWVTTLLRPTDMVMGFAPPNGDARVTRILDAASERGAMTFALPGLRGSYAIEPMTTDPFIHQELVEILYHTLWESVHVFFEHRELGYDVGESSFLYPFLGQESQDATQLVKDVAASITMKVADDAVLRAQVAEQEGPAIANAIEAIGERLKGGGKLIVFGNGGSATDANDFAIDCVAPPAGMTPIPAISLALEPANITAVANDVGVDVIFVRQLIAHADSADVAVAISTSGGSKNVIAALVEARKRGLLTIALLGYDGGEIRRQGLADVSIVVSSDYIPRIQEVQASIYHVIREGLDRLAVREGEGDHDES